MTEEVLHRKMLEEKKEKGNKQPFVSVIVPVYQVEAYLDRCMVSLLAQSYSNYEILLVDDGSKDRSRLICDDYAKKETRVKVIHQENQGLGPARNRGVFESSGDYIVFVDSDDYVAEDFLEYLVNLVEKYQVRIAVTGTALSWEEDGRRQTLSLACEKEQVLSREKALEEMCYGKIFGVSAWGKIYERELAENYPYPACVHEDLATTYQIIGECPAVAVGNRVGYYYFQRKDSLMNQRVEERHLAGLDAAEEELNYMKRWCPAAVPAAEYRCGLKVIEYIPRLLDGSRESRTVFVLLKQEMRLHIWAVLSNRRAATLFKIRCLAVCAGYTAACLSWKMIRWLKKKTGKEGI